MMAAARFFVSGKVQGVFYRAHTCERARALGLAGYARNLRDGRVEVLAQGEPAAIEALAVFLPQASPLCQVREVQREEATDSPMQGFEIA